MAEYKEALATRDGEQDTRLAAERGVKTAYAVNGHSCTEDAEDESPGAAPAQPGRQPAGNTEAAIMHLEAHAGPCGWRLIRYMGRLFAGRLLCAGASVESVERFKRIEAHVEAVLAELEAALGHGFASPELLVRALTHRSLANQLALEDGKDGAEAEGDNERLEFLGDAVLGLVVGEALFLLHPEWSEGELTRVRAQLVSRQHMAEVAAAIGLGNHLRLSRGEDRSGLRRKSTVLSNTMEAVIGALFLDGGLEPVASLCPALCDGRCRGAVGQRVALRRGAGQLQIGLQEHLQAARAGTPVYRVKSESGPDHRKRFLVEVRLKPAEGEPGKPLARGMGSTKKHAEQDAARRALARLTAAADTEAGSPEAAKRRKKQRNEHPGPGSQPLPAAAVAAAAASAHGTRGLASLLRTVVVALFLLTFVLQPFLIPSESMEHTLLVGDFLLVNKQIFAPAGGRGT